MEDDAGLGDCAGMSLEGAVEALGGVLDDQRDEEACLFGALCDGLEVMPVGTDHECGVVVFAILGPEPGCPIVLAASCKRGAVERVYGRAIRRLESEVNGRPDRVAPDEPEIVSASCLHTDPLWRLERDLVAERRESRFEETAAGIHVADVDRNVIEQGL